MVSDLDNELDGVDSEEEDVDDLEDMPVPEVKVGVSVERGQHTVHQHYGEYPPVEHPALRYL